MLNNSLFLDQLIIKRESVKRLLIVIGISIILILFLFFYCKEYYYTGTLSVVNNEIALMIPKDQLNEIKTKNIIIIDGIQNNYNINKISNMKDFLMVYIYLKTKQENIQNQEFKIYLGKEKIIEYIIRIIKNKWKK